MKTGQGLLNELCRNFVLPICMFVDPSVNVYLDGPIYGFVKHDSLKMKLCTSAHVY